MTEHLTEGCNPSSQPLPRRKVFPFLRLPAELRELVYGHLTPLEEYPILSKGLVLSCKQVHREMEKTFVEAVGKYLRSVADVMACLKSEEEQQQGLRAQDQRLQDERQHDQEGENGDEEDEHTEFFQQYFKIGWQARFGGKRRVDDRNTSNIGGLRFKKLAKLADTHKLTIYFPLSLFRRDPGSDIRKIVVFDNCRYPNAPVPCIMVKALAALKTTRLWLSIYEDQEFREFKRGMEYEGKAQFVRKVCKGVVRHVPRTTELRPVQIIISVPGPFAGACMFKAFPRRFEWFPDSFYLQKAPEGWYQTGVVWQMPRARQIEAGFDLCHGMDETVPRTHDWK